MAYDFNIPKRNRSDTHFRYRLKGQAFQKRIGREDLG